MCFVFSPISSMELVKNPWNLQSDKSEKGEKSVFCFHNKPLSATSEFVNEMTWKTHKDEGLWLLEEPTTLLESWNFQPQKRAGLEVELITRVQ